MERNVERMRVLDHSWVLFLSLWSVLFPRLLVVRHCRRCCCRRRCRRRRCCRCAPCSFRPSARDHDHKWAARGPRGASGAPGASGTVLGPSCVVLGLSWKLLGLSWSGIWGRLRAILEGPRRPGSAPGPPGRPFVVVVAASGPPRRRRPPPPPPLPRSIPPRSPLLFLPLDAASSKKIPAFPSLPPPLPPPPCPPRSLESLPPFLPSPPRRPSSPPVLLILRSSSLLVLSIPSRGRRSENGQICQTSTGNVCIYWPSAPPSAVPGLWVRSLLSARWDLVVGLSGASWRQF